MKLALPDECVPVTGVDITMDVKQALLEASIPVKIDINRLSGYDGLCEDLVLLFQWKRHERAFWSMMHSKSRATMLGDEDFLEL
jgi:hypothetical protein